jgi:thymidylate synthase
MSNTLDKQYTDLLQDILDNGVEKKDIPYQKEYVFDNREVETSLSGAELSDIENLTYLFEKYKSTVERGKPNLRAANLLKTYIDVIQVKEVINEQSR